MKTATKPSEKVSSCNDLAHFETFGKGKKAQAISAPNCVIYTRVSTKEQADNNLSLETQRKACQLWALKNNYVVQGYFGGTYESAKTDERKEFNSMLTFLRKCKEKISHIIVYSVDRFSRSGANAIYIAEKLRKEGVVLYSVTQPSDASTTNGSLQQNIQFIFSAYDNDQRREKCMAGVKEKLLSGIWCIAPPTGYDIVRKNGKKEFLLNDKGRLIKKAFQWKAEGLSHESIREKLAERGLKLYNQRISDILRNPFYCGLLAHKALEGKLIEGIQEKAVTKDLFLQVNGILSRHAHGYCVKPENEEVPLKRFLKCEDCGRYLRAYKAWKNQQYYYKCNTIGCNCNRRADALHNAFKEMLAGYQLNVNEDMSRLIALQIIATYNNLNKEKEQESEGLSKQLAEMEKKIKRLEERFIEEEIERDMFMTYKEKFVLEKREIAKELSKKENKVSNLTEGVEKILE